jgi:hypothetical protein
VRSVGLGHAARPVERVKPAIMVIGAGWTIWVVRRSPHIDERTKRTIWFVLMPALAAVIKALSTLGIE